MYIILCIYINISQKGIDWQNSVLNSISHSCETVNDCEECLLDMKNYIKLCSYQPKWKHLKKPYTN